MVINSYTICEPEDLEMVQGLALYRPVGEVSLQQGVELVTSAIALAREHHVPKLMVDTSGLTGFESPSIITRYCYAKDWAAASRGAVRVALVSRPEMIDPQKFQVMVAANNGFISDVFESEEEALTWLWSVD